MTIAHTSDATAVTVHTFGVHYRWQLPDVLRVQLRLRRVLTITTSYRASPSTGTPGRERFAAP
jgi:hypothetical protein